jgi:hypothetical protein
MPRGPKGEKRPADVRTDRHLELNGTRILLRTMGLGNL